MPTKDERITALEREVENLKKQLRYCEMLVGKPVEIAPGVYGKPVNAESKETVSRETQPAASSSESSETKQS